MSSQTFIDLSRWQFATTAAFHMTFPALSVGLAIFVAICYGLYYKTNNPLYLQMFRFWRSIFAIGFALGIVSGIVLTFELGLNWGNYARAVGPILGPMICMEALMAFFLEAGFFGILVWGEGRVSKRVTMISAWLVALGALFSTAWILDANSWMQTPAGYREVNGQFQPTNWLHAIFNPAFNWRFPHMVLAVLISAAWFIAAIGAYYLLRRRALPLARKTMSIALMAAAVRLPIQLNVGDNMATYMTWPVNTGTPFTAGCSAPALQRREVYTEQQVQTAYGVGTLRASASGTPVITILDLGGSWLPSDLKLAGKCFGYAPPRVDQMQGDGVATPIKNADPKTSLDLQTAAAVTPKARFRLVQSTPGGGGILDAFSRSLDDPAGPPDITSLSYGGCAIAENTSTPAFTSVVDSVLAMAALTGVSSFVAAGDSGSTTCGSSVSGTSLPYPAVSPFVTAVGGTRLTLGKGNVRVSETVWNDSAYGDNAAGGGALSRREPRPAYQDGSVPQNHRAVPDVSALADIVPGWPDVLDGTLQPVGGTSGSTPFTAAATALADGSQRAAARPPIGLANGWFYRAASHPGAFFDITTGNNDLAGVGCCQAAVGYDLASGLGVPDWAVLPATLAPPG